MISLNDDALDLKGSDVHSDPPGAALWRDGRAGQIQQDTLKLASSYFLVVMYQVFKTLHLEPVVRWSRTDVEHVTTV